MASSIGSCTDVNEHSLLYTMEKDKTKYRKESNNIVLSLDWKEGEGPYTFPSNVAVKQELLEGIM